MTESFHPPSWSPDLESRYAELGEQISAAAGAYAQPFELVRTYNRAERVTGFFDTALLNGSDFPVLGLVQEMVFDKEKLLSVFDQTVKMGTDPVRTRSGRLTGASPRSRPRYRSRR